MFWYLFDSKNTNTSLMGSSRNGSAQSRSKLNRLKSQKISHFPLYFGKIKAKKLPNIDVKNVTSMPYLGIAECQQSSPYKKYFMYGSMESIRKGQFNQINESIENDQKGNVWFFTHKVNN